METITSPKATRIAALDFTKGLLVLIMVLYHWLNYFISPKGEFYRYLRFLTPSFICISGFLISHTYLSKYDISDGRLPKRLIIRGMKILGVFVLLNVAINFLVPGMTQRRLFFLHMGWQEAISTYVVGNILVAGMGRGVAFYILVPIGYLLLLSAGLLVICRWYKYTFYAVCLLFMAGALILNLSGMESANLELLAIGLLGVILGYASSERINTLTKYWVPLLAAYLCYLGAITVWHEIFPLQVAGVCLSLAIIYMMGTMGGQPGIVKRSILLLGKYSLFGYIAQVALLQVLRRTIWHVDMEIPALALSFLAAVALTMGSVIVVDYLRAKVVFADQLYRAVFA